MTGEASVTDRDAGAIHSVVHISSQIIDPAELSSRVAEARLTIEPAASEIMPGEESPAGLEARAEHLHRLYAVRFEGPPDRSPGVRGRIAFAMKRVAVRLQSWEADAEAARLATDVVSAISDLQRQVERLQESNAILQREVRRLRNEANATGEST